MNIISKFRLGRRSIISFCAFAAISSTALPAFPQTSKWPQKPVRLVVGFAAGGLADLMARIVAQSLSESLGQPVVIDNKTGASGNIGAAEVVRAPADGYTFLLGPTSVETANPWLYKSNVLLSRDLTAVAGIARAQMYLIAKPSLTVSTVPDLISLAKAQPNKLSYASSGAGTPLHLAGELFNQQTGTTITHIPYRGSGPALADLMAGQVDITWDPGTAFPMIRTGKLKLLAVASERKSQFFPDAPTFAELGIKNASLDIWYGVWAPNNTPSDITRKLGEEISKALSTPSVKQRFADAGAEANSYNAAEFRKLLNDETKVLSKLIKDRSIAPE